MDEKPHRWLLSIRFFIVFLNGAAINMIGLMKADLNFDVLTCMVSANQSVDSITVTHIPDAKPEVTWTEGQTQLIVQSATWGGILTVLPAGWVADKYGAKILYLTIIIISIVGTFLTPIAAITSFAGTMCLRFFIGCAQGARWPLSSSMLGRWVPLNEMGLALAILLSGQQLATFLTHIFVVLLCHTNFLGGWPSIFYLTGFIPIIWCVIWAFVLNDKPENQKCLSNKEFRYIKANVASRTDEYEKIPWLSMIKSPAMWACVTASICYTLGDIISVSYLPFFFQHFMQINLSSNYFVNLVSFVLQWIFRIGFAFIADMLKRKTKINHTKISKFFNTFASLGQGLTFIVVGYAYFANIVVVQVFVCICAVLASGFIPGWWTSAQAMAPQYAGTVQSVCQFFTTATLIVFPFIADSVTAHVTLAEYQTLFSTVGGILIFGGIIYLCFGKAEVQGWSSVETVVELEESESNSYLDNSNVMQLEASDSRNNSNYPKF